MSQRSLSGNSVDQIGSSLPSLLMATTVSPVVAMYRTEASGLKATAVAPFVVFNSKVGYVKISPVLFRRQPTKANKIGFDNAMIDSRGFPRVSFPEYLHGMIGLKHGSAWDAVVQNAFCDTVVATMTRPQIRTNKKVKMTNMFYASWRPRGNEEAMNKLSQNYTIKWTEALSC